MKKYVFLALVVGMSADLTHGAQILAIKVGGDKAAEVDFISDVPLGASPKLAIEENRVDLLFPGVGLSQVISKQTDIVNPHALIQRISSFPAEGGGSRVHLIVNGSTDKLRDRVLLQKKEGSVSLILKYPAGSEATLKLLQEEQVAIEKPKSSIAQVKGGFGWMRMLLAIAVFAMAGVGSWYFVRFAKKKTGWKGTRRFLIETVAQAPVGNSKSCVAILRVGSEFVMVGVTPSQVSYLSSLPRLQEQYEEENQLEHSSFKEAISQAARKVTQRPDMNA